MAKDLGSLSDPPNFSSLLLSPFVVVCFVPGQVGLMSNQVRGGDKVPDGAERGNVFSRQPSQRKLYSTEPSFSPFMGHFRSKPGNVPRCINHSVLHLRRPTNISVYTLYPCTYYGMTIIGNGLDYFEI